MAGNGAIFTGRVLTHTVLAVEQAFSGYRLSADVQDQVYKAVDGCRSAMHDFLTLFLDSSQRRQAMKCLLASVPGRACLAICACLDVAYTLNAAADVLYELLQRLNPPDLLPSLGELTDFIRMCQEFSSRLDFSERFARSMLLISTESPKVPRRPKSPRDLAEGIEIIRAVACDIPSEDALMPTTITSSNTTITGRVDCIWLSTLSIWLFKSDVDFQVLDLSSQVIYETMVPRNKKSIVTFIITAKDDGLFIQTAKYEDNVYSRDVDITFTGNGPRPLNEKSENTSIVTTRVLGHGANGPVMEATVEGICVALKQIRQPRNPAVEISREFAILNKLKHRHLIQVIGSYYQHPYFCFFMAPVAQCDLAKILSLVDIGHYPNRRLLEELSGHRLSIKSFRNIVGYENRRLWTLFGCLASAMSYLHEQKVKHKDIKPSNILLSSDGVWLTDFGASRDFAHELTSTSESRERGTLRYCAPEVVCWEESGRSADIFSLGCVFLELFVALSAGVNLEGLRDLCPSKNQSYEANLDCMDDWMDYLRETDVPPLLVSIKGMLRRDKKSRPSADVIWERLKNTKFQGWAENEMFYDWTHLCGDCCR